jgi:D-alanine-D-alanine ligase
MPANRRLRVGVLFGGQSAEHEVSLVSSRAIMAALAQQPDRYEVVPIGITRGGAWLAAGDPWRQLAAQQKLLPQLERAGTPEAPAVPVTLVAGGERAPGKGQLVPLGAAPAATAASLSGAGPLDVVFPVLHGPFGEDGTVQGLLELLGIPYVGSGVLGSACGMDKATMKDLFRQAGLPTPRSVLVLRRAWETDRRPVQKRVADEIGFPCFVKPANLGSSVGVGKARHAGELDACIDDAARYDRKILVEVAVPAARELEVSVMGNDVPEVSVVGEIIPGREFYDYRAKYIDEGSRAVIPAELPPAVAEHVRELARRAYLALDLSGLARVDLLMDGHRVEAAGVMLNEVNTMPGFTPISMYPKLWEASGVPFAELVHRLVELALERHADRARNRVSFDDVR